MCEGVMSFLFHNPQTSAHNQPEWQNKRTEEAEKILLSNRKTTN